MRPEIVIGKLRRGRVAYHEHRLVGHRGEAIVQPDAVYQAAAVPLQALCSHAHESPQRLRTPRRRMELPLKGLSVPEARCLADGTTGFHSGDDAAVAPARLPRALAVTLAGE